LVIKISTKIKLFAVRYERQNAFNTEDAPTKEGKILARL
jgi:hypothetical protein